MGNGASNIRPVEFEGQTALLHPAEGTPRGTVGALPVFIGTDWCCSVWKPSAEALAILNAGGHIQMSVQGRTHMPVVLSASDKFIEKP